ncbi:MAG TPA: AsnC family transcriptional regulator [Clostridiales bacterium]|nr:AsnC family transcriptional regulator [Clostridiales bacterium]
MDDTDRQILSLLKDNARIPAKRIAEKTFLSPTAIATRIERLEEEGYITGYHAHLNPELLGFQVKAFINLEVDPVRKKEFYPYIQSQLNVVECNCVTGDFSMLVEVLFPTTSDLDVFINELQHFGRTKTLIVFSTSVEHRDSFIDVRED